LSANAKPQSRQTTMSYPEICSHSASTNV
jgi:hypothetical protein